MAEFALRPYQQSVISYVRAVWDSGLKRVIVVLPTGAGKSVVAKELARTFKNPLVLAHKTDLVNQLAETIGRAQTVQALRIAQESGRGFLFGPPDLVIWDELHHADSPDWQRLFELFPDVPMLGLTATPWRFNTVRESYGERRGELAIGGAKHNKHGKGLGDLFDCMYVGATPMQLVHDGYLVPVRVIDAVAHQDKLAEKMGVPGISFNSRTGETTGTVSGASANRIDCVDAYQRWGEDRPAMVFLRLIHDAEDAARRFQEQGIKASVVHGKQLPAERAKRIRELKSGRLQVLCNVMALTEGIDIPRVSCVVLDRGCQNLNTYIQITGRAARPFEGKTDAILIDLVGASKRHGHPQTNQEYWVCTSEARDESDQRCEVCGTRVSPMFPTRCMRCDPFYPPKGSPVALLDTGVRVYHAIAIARLRGANAQGTMEALETFALDHELTSVEAGLVIEEAQKLKGRVEWETAELTRIAGDQTRMAEAQAREAKRQAILEEKAQQAERRRVKIEQLERGQLDLFRVLRGR